MFNHHKIFAVFSIVLLIAKREERRQLHSVTNVSRGGGLAREQGGAHRSDGHRDECRCGELPQ